MAVAIICVGFLSARLFPAAAAESAPRAWGYNGHGQLGDGSRANSPVPVAASGPSAVVAVTGGARHSLALGRDGVVWPGARTRPASSATARWWIA